MELSTSEKFFLECFDNVVDERVIVYPEQIKTYGKMVALEAEIKILNNFYDIRSTTGIRTTIEEKKKQLEELYKQ